ncbi:MAG: 5'-methylthioadenosine/adenosylhomocysteine nucleosidase [Clostridia bacterium]|nr:5'-methylthioadenosine/adenosylhomocysteine nucleosidase [Clostridia bacterium]
MEILKYGIIAAMKEEMEEIKNIMDNIEECKIYELSFFKGVIADSCVILVESGVGKVNASRVTQILIDKFDIDIIINVGSGAAANDKLDIGDIVIGETLVQHDFDITAFGHKKGYISNVGNNIKSDNNLINKMKDVVSNLSNSEYKVQLGTIASGDIFCTDINLKNNIRDEFKADVIEMESAAVAQVCELDNIPFIIIRSISDKPNGNNQITFEEFLKFASRRCAIILEKFIKEYEK